MAKDVIVVVQRDALPNEKEKIGRASCRERVSS